MRLPKSNNVKRISACKASFYFVLAVLWVTLGHGQSRDTPTVASVFNKVKAVYSKDAYTFNVSYALYPNDEASSPEDTYGGKVIKKSSRSYYSKINHTEFVQIGETHIKVNHDEKALLYLQESAQHRQDLTDIASFLNVFESSSLEVSNGIYVCELRTHNITQMPYSKIIVHVNSTTYEIERQILYLFNTRAKSTTSTTKEGSSPRLEITFTPLKAYHISDNTFSVSKYIDASSTRLRPSKALSGYQIINPQL